MKKLFSAFLPTAFLITGLFFAGCETTAQKEQNAEQKVKDAKEDLHDAQDASSAEARKVANAEEWKTFKSQSEVQIRANEVQIADLKAKIKKQGKTFDALYASKIDVLESRNQALKARMDTYEKSQSDWETFMREFRHDMDELGNALKDITVDNKK